MMLLPHRARRRSGFSLIEVTVALVILTLMAVLVAVGSRALLERAKVTERDSALRQVHNDATAAARMGSARGVTFADTLPRALESAPFPEGSTRVAADGSWFEVSYDELCRRMDTTVGQTSGCEPFEPDPDTDPVVPDEPDPAEGEVPTAPRAVEASYAGGGIAVSWVEPVDEGGSPIVSYTASTTPENLTCTASAPTTACTIEDLTPGVEYQIAVVATNAAGDSPAGEAPFPVTAALPVLTVGSDPEHMPGMVYDNADNAWSYTGTATPIVGGQTIPALPGEMYELTAEVRRTTTNTNHRFYLGVAPLDIDGNTIVARHHMFHSEGGTPSHTTLAQDLSPGDTVIHLTGADGWDTSPSAFRQQAVIVWGYRDSHGNAYPVGTYSRHVTDRGIFGPGDFTYDAGTDTWQVALSTPWSVTNPHDGDGVWAAGTPLSQSDSGSSYKYIAAVNPTVPTAWTTFTGTIAGVDFSGTNIQNMYPPGTTNVAVLLLPNYPTNESDASRTMQIRNIELRPVE